MVMGGSDSTIYDYMANARQNVFARASGAEITLTAAYRDLLERANERLAELSDLISETVTGGGEPTRHWLFQQERYKLLVRQLDADYSVFANLGQNTTLDAMQEGLEEGANGVRNSMLMGTKPGRTIPAIQTGFATPNTDAIVSAGLADQSPMMQQLWDKFPADAAMRARNAVIEGVGLGWNAERIAQELRNATGMSHARALTIARTETMRAFREGTRAAMTDMSSALEGWVWMSAANKRTCAICWSMHGEVFQFAGEGSGISMSARELVQPIPSKEELEYRRGFITAEEAGKKAVSVLEFMSTHGLPTMDTHPNCRCMMVPRPKSYAELTGNWNIPDDRPVIRKGEELFRQLPSPDQFRILGRARWKMFQSGEIGSLKEFVQWTDGPWGRTPGLYSLKQLINANGPFAVSPTGYWRDMARWTGPTGLRNVWEMTKTVADYIEREFGVKVMWNGKIMMVSQTPRPVPGNTLGVAGFDGIMYLEDGLVMRSTSWRPGLPPRYDQLHVLFHEMFHFTSPDRGGMQVRLSAFNRGWEEGVAEANARIYREGILRSLGYEPTAGALSRMRFMDATHYYQRYINPLEDLQKAMGMSSTEFWGQLGKTPFHERLALVTRWKNAAMRESHPFLQSELNHLMVEIRSTLGTEFTVNQTRIRRIGQFYEEAKHRLIFRERRLAVNEGRRARAQLFIDAYDKWLYEEVQAQALEWSEEEAGAVELKMDKLMARLYSGWLLQQYGITYKLVA